jgi:hypothetical protein
MMGVPKMAAEKNDGDDRISVISADDVIGGHQVNIAQ